MLGCAVLPQNSQNSQNLLLRCPPTDFTDLHRYLGCAVLPQNTPNSQNLLLRCPPTDFTDLHRYLGCAVLPQNTPNSQNLLLRCPPTDFTDLHRCLECAVLPQNTEFVSVGMAGMPYPPTSVRIRVICGRLFSARSFCEFRAFCGNIFSPTDFTDLHRYLWCAVLPQNSQNLAAWVWQECHTLLHPCHLWEALLCQKFCVFGAFRGSFFTACSVGAAETAAPTGVIHGSSAHISPSHHLTTTTPFHLEPSLLHVLPVLWVRLRHHLRLVDAQPGEHDCRRCERHRHAVVVVGVDRL